MRYRKLFLEDANEMVMPDEDAKFVRKPFEKTDRMFNRKQSSDCLVKTAEEVMAAYQNACKWLDTCKEVLFTDFGCVFFASYIHNLAHTMPLRFDKFGDMLHTIDMKVPYPATARLTEEPTDIEDVFDVVFSCLDTIKEKLNAFIDCTDKSFHGLAVAAENLLNDIEAEYTPLYKMYKAFTACNNDMVKFDKWVNQYVNNRANLNESKSTARRNKTILSESLFK